MMLVIAALAVTSYLTRSERVPRPPQFVEGIVSAYSRTAVDTYEREGAVALDSFLKHMEREVNIRARLFDDSGRDLTGDDAAPEEREMASLVAQTGDMASRMIGGGKVIEARPEPARDGGRYAFVAVLPLAPPASSAERRPPRSSQPFQRFLPPMPLNFLLGESSAALVARLLAVVLTAGILCYLLARYIVSPVIKLREVTNRVAGGDLSARVSPTLGNRHDELADMGRDFDVMAARIEALMSAQVRLLRDISQELRSPLARLNVALDLARKRSGAEAASALSRIEREATRLNEMIGQLLTLTRWETGSDGMRREQVNLCALVREVAEDADFEARSQNREVRVIACDECETMGTHALLRSAFENVVRNAVRHAPAETAVKISLRCLCEGESGCAVFSVEDDGEGVPEESLSEIFRPFYRVDDSRTRETGGTGLGLAITERAVQLHGGAITAKNMEGGGFVVEIRLPVVARASARP
ncbi:MAG: two-component system, OmpR family, sensor histidine kinase CpxA [Acidobacteriota bacterium]|nr:two-component system, OmpR family, sensor histidine kinase CpxA [Acidobacteriota bacterium]